MNFQLKEEVKDNTFSSCPNFVFALYTLISPNLKIIFKKITNPGETLRDTPCPKITKSLPANSKMGS